MEELGHSDILPPCGGEADSDPEEEGLGDGKHCTLLLGSTYQCKTEDGTYHDAKVEKFRMNKRAGKEEYFVHYVGLPRRQAEWVDKTRLVLSEKQDNVKNGADQKISTNEESTQNAEEEEPETKKPKVDASVMVCKDEKRTCLSCGELGLEPVSVECSHSFCSSCMEKASANGDCLSCPECKKVETEKLTTNLTLDGLAKAAAALMPVKKPKDFPFVVCEEHEERLKLYCIDDHHLGCIICRDSLKHSGHKFLPIMDMVELYEAQLSALLSPLEKAWKNTSELTIQQSKKIEELQNTRSECRQHILSEFGNLYNFLKEQKEQLLGQLREQNKRLLEEMETNAAKIKKCRESSHKNMALCKEKVYETEPIRFLDGIDEFIKGSREWQKIICDNKVLYKQLCRGTFKGPLQYFAWKQMKSIVPVPECEEQPVDVMESPIEPIPINNSDPKPAAPAMVMETACKLVKPPALKLPGRAKEIWLIGNGYLNSVNRHAEKCPLGLNLGFERQTCTIRWFGMTNVSDSLAARLHNLQNYKKPNVVFFIFSCHRHFDSLKTAASLFPNATFILSGLYPQMAYESTNKRTNFLCDLKQFAERRKCDLLTYDALEKCIVTRCSKEKKPIDRDNLTRMEADMLITWVQDTLMNALTKRFQSGFKQSVLPAPHPAVKTVSDTGRKLVHQPLPVVWRKTKSKLERPPALNLEGTKEIVLIGNGYLQAVYIQAKKTHLGLSLGFDMPNYNVRWFCLNECCDGLVDTLSALGSPDILFFHFGSNCLGNVDFTPLPDVVIDGLIEATKLFPNAEIILSDMSNPPAGGLSKFSSSLREFAEIHRCALLAHDELQYMMDLRCSQSTMQMNFNYISIQEMNVLLAGVQDALMNALIKKFKPEELKYEEPAPVVLPGRPAKVGPTRAKVQRTSAKVGPTPAESKLRKIWIIGNAYISKVALHAKNVLESGSTNLGFNNQEWVVRWMGDTTRWSNCLTYLHKASRKLGMPSIVYLHVGSDDLGEICYNTLVDDFTYDMGRLTTLYPKTQFIFSTILPRSEWQSNEMEDTRKRFNAVVGQYAETRGFEVAYNQKIEEALLNRFHEGQLFDYLNFQENHIFLSSIRFAIEKAMQKFMRLLQNKEPAIENPEPQKQVRSTGGTLIVIVPGTDPAKSAAENKEAAAAPPECPVNSKETPEELEELPVIPVFPKNSEVKQIWVVGNSFICRAARQAYSNFGTNLGFKEATWSVHWMGRAAMRWDALLPELNDLVSELGAPDVLFAHLGDNDMGSTPQDQLLKVMEIFLSRLTKWLPKTELIFSTMLPRAEWLTNGLEQNRREVNAALAGYGDRLGFAVVGHGDIEEKAIPRFKSGGSGVISDSEYDLFVVSIRDSVEKAMLRVEKRLLMTLVQEKCADEV